MSEAGSGDGSRDDDTSWDSVENIQFMQPHLILGGKDDDEATRPENRVPWSPRNSFTAESPYFTSFCDSEVESLALLTDTMRDITSRTRTFSKTGVLMSEATRRLALSCKLRQDSYEEKENPVSFQERMKDKRQKAVGQEMTTLLGQLGEVRRRMALLKFIFEHCPFSNSFLFISYRFWKTWRTLNLPWPSPLKLLSASLWKPLLRRNFRRSVFSKQRPTKPPIRPSNCLVVTSMAETL